MPNARLQNPVPNSRVSSYQTGRSGVGEVISSISAGMPIGLLLVLTYAGSVASGSEVAYGDFRPSNRIFNQSVNNRIFNT